MRHYRLHVTTHGHQPVPNSPKECFSESAKVGEIAVIIFRRVFGRPANKEVWHSKGFMAQACDRRGNGVLVEQINHNELPGFDTRSGTFPLTITPNS